MIKDITSWLSFLESDHIYVRPFVMINKPFDEDPDRTRLVEYYWLEWIQSVGIVERDHPLSTELLMRWRMCTPDISEKQAVGTWMDLPMLHVGQYRIPMAYCLRGFSSRDGELAVAHLCGGALWTVLPKPSTH